MKLYTYYYESGLQIGTTPIKLDQSLNLGSFHEYECISIIDNVDESTEWSYKIKSSLKES